MVALAVSVPVDAALLGQAFLHEVALSVAVLVPAEFIFIRLFILQQTSVALAFTVAAVGAGASPYVSCATKFETLSQGQNFAHLLL